MNSNISFLMRGVVVLYGLIFLVVTYMIYMENNMRGFGDGYKTAYDRAVATPHTLFALVACLGACYFLYKAFKIIDKVEVKALTIQFVVFAVALGLVYWAIDWYLISYLKLDTGFGG